MLLYIEIFSARTCNYWDVVCPTIATPTDVLIITGLEHRKIVSGMKLTNIIWMLFCIHTFVLSYFLTELHNVSFIVEIQQYNTWFLYIPDLMVNMLNLRDVEVCIIC